MRGPHGGGREPRTTNCEPQFGIYTIIATFWHIRFASWQMRRLGAGGSCRLRALFDEIAASDVCSPVKLEVEGPARMPALLVAIGPHSGTLFIDHSQPDFSRGAARLPVIVHPTNLSMTIVHPTLLSMASALSLQHAQAFISASRIKNYTIPTCALLPPLLSEIAPHFSLQPPRVLRASHPPLKTATAAGRRKELYRWTCLATAYLMPDWRSLQIV
jgi:hypothetical protein